MVLYIEITCRLRCVVYKNLLVILDRANFDVQAVIEIALTLKYTPTISSEK